jgi:hypothetical protein
MGSTSSLAAEMRVLSLSACVSNVSDAGIEGKRELRNGFGGRVR